MKLGSIPNGPDAIGSIIFWQRYHFRSFLIDKMVVGSNSVRGGRLL